MPKGSRSEEKIEERKNGQLQRGREEVKRRAPINRRPQPYQHQQQQEQGRREAVSEVRKQRQREDDTVCAPPQVALTGKFITNLTLAISGSLLKVRNWEKNGPMSWDDVPRLVTEAVNWAMGSSLDDKKIWKTMNSFEF